MSTTPVKFRRFNEKGRAAMSTTQAHRLSVQRGESNSYAPEVKVNNDPKWYGNALRFPTEAEALANVRDLMGRWLLVTDTRVVPSDDAPTYNWTDAGLVAIKQGEQA